MIDQLELTGTDGVDRGPAPRRRGGYTSLEICAGAGGAALGVEQAGFHHVALVEIEPPACATLRLNRPGWNVIEGDLREFHAWPFVGIDLLAGGVPCPPFSTAGLQGGAGDDRDLFPEALRLVAECRPRAVMLENVPGLMGTAFAGYRQHLTDQFRKMGYRAQWTILQAADFGVPQLRPRVLCVALPDDVAAHFAWPTGAPTRRVTVGEALRELMAAGGWEGAAAWSAQATRVAPTLVGGSKRHGGPDLGPTRARAQWATLGVDGMGIVDAPPPPGFEGMPRLTVAMAAVIQGFPTEWQIWGKKTAAYRQVGNAFPPPVACAVATQIRAALRAADRAAVRRAPATPALPAPRLAELLVPAD